MEIPENGSSDTERSGFILDADAFEIANRILEAFPEPAAFEDFGSYRIERLIGKGGMGEVFLARDESADRWVAIKFLARPWGEPDLRERFTREIKTLAKLEHSLIARLYDIGTHPNGTPYFAMEYVEGKPLDEYCREREYSIEERLRLFRSVCEAVQYAHSRLVVHRDLKPSNILVKNDGTPKLLDFGIAKELENLGVAASQTHTQLRFTRAFAAPEQLRGEPVGVYTDVYALGVILYQLLAGRLPYDLEGCTPAEAEIAVTGSREPDKPLTVAGRVKADLRTAWNDLDVLCLTAMKNDVPRRYPSVVELTQDIGHYLKGEPLKARPDALSYRAGKFMRRNRRAVVASALAFTLIVALISFFTLRLAAARDRALAEAARTQRVERFMLNLFDGGDKEAGPANSLRVVTLLDRGNHEAQSLNNEPAVQAELYQTLGGMYQKLGQFDNADKLLQAALERKKRVYGPDDGQVAESMLNLGLLRTDQARLDDAERLIRGAIAMNQRHLSPGKPSAVNATAALGRVLNERGQYDRAIEVLTRAVRLQSGQGGLESDLAASLVELGDAHFYLGHYAISDSLYQRALATHRQMHGETHPLVADDLVDLGNIQFQLGHYAEAEQYDRRALEINQSWYGKDHPATARDVTYLAQALSWENRDPEAVDLLAGELASLERAVGSVHPRIALLLDQLGMLALQAGKLDEAAADFSRMAEIYRAVYGDRHQMTLVALSNLASVYMRQNHYARAEPIFRDVIRGFTVAQSAGHLNTGIARVKLGRTLLKQERYREAESESLAGYEILMKQTSPSVEWLVESRKDLVKEYEALNQPEKAAQFRIEPGVRTEVKVSR